MPYKCCVIGCRTGYDSQRDTNLIVPLYSFPNDSDEKDSWVAALPNLNFYSNKSFSHMSPSLAAQHFDDTALPISSSRPSIHFHRYFAISTTTNTIL